jgi:hypothetical protein
MGRKGRYQERFPTLCDRPDERVDVLLVVRVLRNRLKDFILKDACAIEHSVRARASSISDNEVDSTCLMLVVLWKIN